MKINLDLDLFNASEKKNIFDITNLENKLNEDNTNIINNDIFPMKQDNFFENIKNNCDNNFTFNSCLEKKPLEKNNNNINLPLEKLDKNIKKYTQKILRPKNLDTFLSFKKPFRTFRTKLIPRNSHCIQLRKKSNKPKIFHIEKIFNKKEYKDAHEKEEKEDDIKYININKYKISLKKIKQIYINSCLKIYSYFNDNSTFNEMNLNDDAYISNIQNKVCETIKTKKISSSKMNQILQVNDDDKYRKHYFMFTSEAKEFCLNLMKINHLPFDVVMKMCKVPRKSLRRWLYVGSQRKKGCGRKTKNPEMEEKLVEWCNEISKKKGIYITSKMVREKAMRISEDKDFLASKGWLEKFKKKFNIQIHSNRSKRFKKKTCSEKNLKTSPKNTEEKRKSSSEINISKDTCEDKK
jgi:hypothetical protein